MKNKINLKIDGIDLTVEQGTKILDAAKELNIYIPTLCFHEDLQLADNCRICVVEQKGKENLVPSCSTIVAEGMEIYTNTEKVRKMRKQMIQLILQEHNEDCTMCYKSSAINYRQLLTKVL